MLHNNMNKYQKIFGTGPRGLVISLLILSLCVLFEENFKNLAITEYNWIRYIIFGTLFIITITIVIWSVISLPPSDRGNKLITDGALKFFRHPLYGAFLSFFNFGLATLLNNWIYIFWAILQIPIWHWNVEGEENMMREAFPNEYESYSKRTGRFFPKLFKKL